MHGARPAGAFAFPPPNYLPYIDLPFLTQRFNPLRLIPLWQNGTQVKEQTPDKFLKKYRFLQAFMKDLWPDRSLRINIFSGKGLDKIGVFVATVFFYFRDKSGRGEKPKHGGKT